MVIPTLKVGLVGAIALIALAPAALAPAALASSVSINTDRVQVQVGNNGQVDIRSLANGPLILPPVTTPHVGASLLLPRANAGPRCVGRSHSAHSTRSTAGGNVVYSENRSTTQVCQ